MSKHIFPLILDGALQAVSASGSSTAWNGLTSYVEVDSSGGDETITIADGTLPGTLVTVIKKGGTNTITVNPASAFAADQVSVALAEDNEMCTFFWDNSKWRVFNQAEGGLFNGGAVANATTFSSTVAVTGAATLSSTLAVTGAATFSAGSQNAAVARTATADGTGTGQIAAGTSFVTVTCDSADKIITLPAPVVGNVIYLMNGGTGYELRTSAPASIAINGGSAADAESAVGANTLVRCVCTSSTTWVASKFATDGTESKLEEAAA